MWNLYEIEKKYEAHVKEVEERSRKAHWYTKGEKKGFLPDGAVLPVSLLAVLLIGFITVYELF